MSEEKVKFGYFRTYNSTDAKSKSGFITVALKRVTDDNGQKHVASFAFCSPKDHFKKALGRKIAESRLNSNKQTVEIIGCKGSIIDVINQALVQAIDEDIVPIWVYKAFLKGLIYYGLSDVLDRTEVFDIYYDLNEQYENSCLANCCHECEGCDQDNDDYLINSSKKGVCD